MKFLAPNRALVVVDSSFAPHAFVAAHILPVLEFWGLPFDILDLSQPQRHPHAAQPIGVVILPQEGVAPERLAQAAPLLEQAVNGGAGIVNCDHFLEVKHDAATRSLSLLSRPVDARPVTGVKVSDPRLFVARMQRSCTDFRFKRPVPAIVGGRNAAAVALVGDDGMPLLELTRTGTPIANWRLSTWMWSDEFFGFTRGLDALLWRTILWAARKPFAMAAFPPVGRFRIDDCRGLIRGPADMEFLDVFEEFEEVPNLGICVDAVTNEGWKHLAAKARKGGVEVAPHVMKPEIGIYDAPDAPRAPAGATGSSGNIDSVAESLRRKFSEQGCPMSQSISDHNHVITARGLTIAAQLDMRYRMNVMRVGETWESVHRRWRPRPYGAMHFALDWFADDNSIFTAINHQHTLSDSFVETAPGSFLCTSFGGFTNDRWDFLNGLVRSKTDKELDRARDRLMRHAEICLTSLFFCGSISHTHFCSHLAPEEWRYLLRGYRSYTNDFGYMPLGYDRIAQYAARRSMMGDVAVDMATPAPSKNPADHQVWVMSARGDREGTEITWSARTIEQPAQPGTKNPNAVASGKS